MCERNRTCLPPTENEGAWDGTCGAWWWAVQCSSSHCVRQSRLVVDGKGSVVEVARPLSCAAVTISSKGTLTGMKPLPTMDSDWCSGESTRQRVFVPDGWTAESGAYLARKRWARIQTRQIPWYLLPSPLGFSGTEKP